MFVAIGKKGIDENGADKVDDETLWNCGEDIRSAIRKAMSAEHKRPKRSVLLSI